MDKVHFSSASTLNVHNNNLLFRLSHLNGYKKKGLTLFTLYVNCLIDMLKQN